MGWLKLQYFLLVFFASLGILQAVFSWRKLRGLQFFGQRIAAYLFAAATVIGSFVWFYGAGNRNTLPVLEGSQQTSMFMAATAAAVVFTVLLSSAINASRLPRTGSGTKCGNGLDDLRHTTYLRCLAATLAKVANRARSRERHGA